MSALFLLTASWCDLTNCMKKWTRCAFCY